MSQSRSGSREGAGGSSGSDFNPNQRESSVKRGRKRLPVPQNLEELSDNERRRVLRRDRNRANAQASRMRKAQRMETMEAKLTVLRDEITTLKLQLADKQAEIDALKRNTRVPDPTDLPTPSGTSPSRVRPPLPSQAGGARRTGRAHPPPPQQRNRSPVTRSGSLGLSGLHLAEESLPTCAVEPAADAVKPRSRKVRRGVPAPSTAAEERDKAEGEALAAAALAHFSTHAGTQGGQGPATGTLARASSLPSAPNKPMGGSPHLRVKPKPGASPSTPATQIFPSSTTPRSAFNSWSPAFLPPAGQSPTSAHNFPSPVHLAVPTSPPSLPPPASPYGGYTWPEAVDMLLSPPAAATRPGAGAGNDSGAPGREFAMGGVWPETPGEGAVGMMGMNPEQGLFMGNSPFKAMGGTTVFASAFERTDVGAPQLGEQFGSGANLKMDEELVRMLSAPGALDVAWTER